MFNLKGIGQFLPMATINGWTAIGLLAVTKGNIG